MSGPSRLALCRVTRVHAAVVAVLLALPAVNLQADTNKLSFEQKVELLQGISAEFATARITLPRSRKALRFFENGNWEEKQWDEANFKDGPAARPGDIVQITKLDIDDDKITVEINDGSKKESFWSRIQIGTGNQTVAPGRTKSNAQLGTSIEVIFNESIEGIDTARLKEILSPLLDFDNRTASELYVETLPPPIQEAIREERVIVGMDPEQVLLALGRPRDKVREYRNNVEYEEWIYGLPPGVMKFIVFANQSVVEIKEMFAGLTGNVNELESPDR